jgi:tripartite-type tricarboxylate transporter receptor subunit TctC
MTKTSRPCNSRRSMIKACVAGLLAMSVVAGSPRLQAQQWPAKQPIRMIVPGAAGTSPDILARTIAKFLSERLNQSIVVVNRPGGGGNIGHAEAAKSTADGYTLLVTSDQLSINQSLFRDLKFHALESFIPVTQAIISPQVLVVPSALPVRTPRELSEYIRARSGKLNFGSPQLGTVGHLSGELFKSGDKLDIVHVPFQGATFALQELAAGRIDMMFVTLPPAMAFIKAGTIRPLAVSTAQRNKAVPDVPTMQESGYAAFNYGAWQGVFVPTGTPADIVSKLNAEINAVLAMPEAIKTLENAGFTPVGGSSEEFRKVVADTITRWEKVVQQARVKVE